jgi:hypothetical protein
MSAACAFAAPKITAKLEKQAKMGGGGEDAQNLGKQASNAEIAKQKKVKGVRVRAVDLRL